MSKRTPLYNKHRELDARIINFGGFEMPVQYKGIKLEHRAVREGAGLFDVSHMGEFFISGSGALSFVQNLTINDVSRLRPGQVQYSAICYENGGIVDDLLVYMLAEDHFMLVVNASGIERDREWILSHRPSGVRMEDHSDAYALLALQGPRSRDLLQQMTDTNLSAIDSFSFVTGTVAGQRNVMISATGYTGEKGFELYFNTKKTDPGAAWDTLMDTGSPYGLEPVGLGARDTLRLEMGYPLYGNDLSPDTTPLEAGLGWITRLDKGPFIGSGALQKQKKEGVRKRLCGFETGEPGLIPRPGYGLLDGAGNRIGTVTSGTQSVTRSIGIGMGYLPPEYDVEGKRVYISIRKNRVPAQIVKPPFIQK